MTSKFFILLAFIIGLFINGCISKIKLSELLQVDKPIKIDIKKDNLHNWQYKDYFEDSLPGISLRKAYRDIIKNRTGTTVIVAIIDTEIDIKHEDLKKQIWVNPKEIPDNGTDDDKNGYVDDVHGWNFIGNTQGENITYTNYEYVRVIKNYEAKYANKNLEDIPENEKADFRMFRRAKQRYEAELKTTLTYDSIYKAYYNVRDSLKYYFKDKSYTWEMLDSLQNEIPGLEKYIEPVYTTLKYKISENEIQQHMKFLRNNLDKYLNPNLNNRKIVGDDSDNFSDRDYGNPNVSGDISKLSHGTTVAGPIAANRNNNTGIDGIIDNVKIMPLCISTRGDEHDKDIALAIRYAVDNGASVINMSSGKEFSLHPDWVNDALTYAAEKDVLFITSAGNDNVDLDKNPYYPNDIFFGEDEMIDNFIVVGSISRFIGKNWKTTSNYGKNNVDIFAPGENIYTTYPNNTYKFERGTSIATPIVSGVAALIWSYYPEFSASQVKEIILQSGIAYNINIEIDQEDGAKKMIPFSELSKSGKVINAYNALLMAGKMAK